MMGRLTRFLLVFALVLMPFRSASAFGRGSSVFFKRFDEARSLYHNGMYAAAQRAFTDLSSSVGDASSLERSEIEAYRVMCDIMAGRVNAEWAVGVFCEKYPTAPELSMVRYALASRYFDCGEYARAGRIFSVIDKRHLYRRWRTEFEFKRSFCSMRTGDYAVASAGFESIVSGPHCEYSYPSIFYLAYVRYTGQRFEEAIALFDKCRHDTRFALFSSYYILECNFMLGNYASVASDGPEVYAAAEGDLKPRIARIMSQACFAIGDRKAAAVYLEDFRSSGRNLTRNDYYFSGMLSYGMKKYDDALLCLGKVTAAEDSLSQNAWHLIAGCHLAGNNRLAALDAFREASEMDFDADVKEDAMFNYAKLSFDINSDISRFDEYIRMYPDSGRADEINNYVAAAFILSKDYASAIDALRKVKVRTPEADGNLRSAAYMRAMQNIGDGAFRSALEMLAIARGASSGDDALACLTDYWRAECLYRDGKVEDAASLYGEVLRKPAFASAAEAPLAVYSLGYCHFRMGRYNDAIGCFGKYLESGDTLYVRDATIRMADSYFLSEAYSSAAPIYESVYESGIGDDLYPGLRGAASWDKAGDRDRSLSLLRSMAAGHRSSPMYPRVLLSLGRAYASSGNERDAQECFFRLLGMKSDSTCYAGALMELASMSTSGGRLEKAAEYYKTVIADCPQTGEADKAISLLEDVYGRMNRPGEFLAYIDASGMSDVKSDGEREKMLYASVSRLYGNGLYGAALNSAQSLLAAYPDGEYSSRAKYLLARSLEATGRREAAMDAYMEVSSSGDADIALPSLEAYADIACSLGRYDRAVKAYGSVILSDASSKELKLKATSGRMRSSFELKKYDNVITDAQKLMSMRAVPDSVVREAGYFLAKSYLRKENREFAIPALASLSADSGDRFGAEAAFLLIMDAYNSGNFKAVEARVGILSDSGTKEKYWLARSFIVLGDSYADSGDIDRAEAVYRKVADGYGKSDDIPDRVKGRLARIESKRKEAAG